MYGITSTNVNAVCQSCSKPLGCLNNGVSDSCNNTHNDLADKNCACQLGTKSKHVQL